MFFKRLLKISLLTVLIAMLIAVAGCGGSEKPSAPEGSGNAPAEQPKPKRENVHLSLGTAGTGGAYYPIGSAMADIVSKNVEGVQCSAEVTGGAVENPRLVQEGDCDWAMTNMDLMYFACTGTGDKYPEKYDIAPMFVTTPSVVQVVTLENSGINSIADLKGKKVAIGPMGGGTASVFSIVAKFYGYTIDDIKASYISFSEGIHAMIDGNVDAVIVQAAVPSSAIMELTATNKPFKIVPYEKEKLDAIHKDFPYYSGFTVPKDMYAGLKEDVLTLCLNNVAFCRNDMPEDVVYDIVKAIYENLDVLKNAHASTSVMDVKTGWDVPVPLHPGAEKYFKEQGVLK